jgi:hypothetical protein
MPAVLPYSSLALIPIVGIAFEWITGTRTCHPLECLADACLSSPPLEVLESCLTREDFQRNMREAVDDHVNKNLDSFQFCYTPGCSGICRLDTSSPSSCLASLAVPHVILLFVPNAKKKNMKIFRVSSIERLRFHLIVSESRLWTKY